MNDPIELAVRVLCCDSVHDARLQPDVLPHWHVISAHYSRLKSDGVNFSEAALIAKSHWLRSYLADIPYPKIWPDGWNKSLGR